MTIGPVAAVLLRAGAVLTATPVLVYLAVTGLLSGDAATVRTGGRATDAEVAALRASLGLDLPWWQGVLRWLGRAIQGDLGVSALSGLPVATLLAERLPTAAALVGGTMLVAVPLTALLGWFVSTGRWGVTTVTAVAALPIPVVAVLLTAVLAVQLDLVPSVSLVPAGSTLGREPRLLVLPALTLGVPTAAYAGVLLGGVAQDIRALPHVEDARVRGLPSALVTAREIGPFLIAPALRVLAVTVGAVFASATVVENIYAIPGVGALLVSSIANRDVPVVLATTTLAALVVLVGLVLADLVTLRWDPEPAR